MGPGATAFTFTPWAAPASASDLVRVMMPALEAE